LQLVHDSGARLHQAVPVPQQLPQITILSARHPDLWKVILQHQSQNMLCTLAIGLLLTLPLPGDLGGVSDPQLHVQFCQQSLELARLHAGFRPHAYVPSLDRQLTAELLCFLAVLEPPFLEFP
jgi:hypothetical protein